MLRVGAAVRQVVRRRQAQRLLQLPRPPRRGGPRRQGRLPLGGRARRHPHHHLRRAARRGAAVRQRAEGPGRPEGRPGRHLHADDPRAARSRCWPAPASAPRTRSCSAGSRPTRSSDRINDAEAKVLITADGGWRRGAAVPLKANADVAAGRHARRSSTSSSCGAPRPTSHMEPGSRPLVPRADGRRPTPTARPSRWTASTCSTCSTRRARRPSPRASCTRPAATSRRSRSPTSTCSTCTPTTDVYWCAADIGWVTGHSYIVYGPLCNGATSVMYEGTPDNPGAATGGGTIVEQYGVTILYTAPDRDPHLHEVGRGGARQARPVVAAAARLGRRAHQPRGVDVVPRSTSAAGAARSSTRGGRPRPAAS